MDNRKINHTNGVEPPVDGKMVWLMDKDSIIDCSKDMLSDQYSSSDLIYEAIANKELDLEEYGIYGSDDCCISSADFCHIPMLMKAVPCLSQRKSGTVF